MSETQLDVLQQEKQKNFICINKIVIREIFLLRRKEFFCF